MAELGILKVYEKNVYFTIKVELKEQCWNGSYLENFLYMLESFQQKQEHLLVLVGEGSTESIQVATR